MRDTGSLSVMLQQIFQTLHFGHAKQKCLPDTITIVCLSLLTMTNLNQMREVPLFVCSKTADETNLSSNLPVTDRTREV